MYQGRKIMIFILLGILFLLIFGLLKARRKVPWLIGEYRFELEEKKHTSTILLYSHGNMDKKCKSC